MGLVGDLRWLALQQVSTNSGLCFGDYFESARALEAAIDNIYSIPSRVHKSNLNFRPCYPPSAMRILMADGGVVAVAWWQMARCRSENKEAGIL